MKIIGTLPSSSVALTKLGLRGRPVSAFFKCDKCTNNSLAVRRFLVHRSKSSLSNVHNSVPDVGKSDVLGMGHSSNCWVHHFSHDSICSPFHSEGSEIGEEKESVGNFHNLESKPTHFKNEIDAVQITGNIIQRFELN